MSFSVGDAMGTVAAARKDLLEVRYRSRRETSQALWDRARGVLPNGVSGEKHFAPYPLFIDSAQGAHVSDVDGNDYVDLLMGVGPMLLGHRHPAIEDALCAQLARSTNPWMPTSLSVGLAERIRTHMPYLERIRFTNTGSEATRSAVRVARAVTGRSLVAKCEGAFHGSDDMFLVSSHSSSLPGSDNRPSAIVDYAGLLPDVETSVLVLPFNDPESAAALIAEHAHDLAAVILEPVAFSTGGAVPATPAFARTLREATTCHDIPLIFDEVVCAYRLGLAGAPAYLDVVPDLSAIGKAIGGGMPVGAFGGSAELMELALGAGAAERKIFQSGTYTENPLAMAAGHAVLDVLEHEPILECANQTGDLLRRGLAECFASRDVEATVTGVASIAQVHFGASQVENRRHVVRANVAAAQAFQLGMVVGGVLWPPGHPALTSGAHTIADIDRVLTTADAVVRDLLDQRIAGL
jgi:glutamate-1-semialdehyde 2,1-aminomutase